MHASREENTHKHTGSESAAVIPGAVDLDSLPGLFDLPDSSPAVVKSMATQGTGKTFKQNKHHPLLVSGCLTVFVRLEEEAKGCGDSFQPSPLM